MAVAAVAVAAVVGAFVLGRTTAPKATQGEAKAKVLNTTSTTTSTPTTPSPDEHHRSPATTTLPPATTTTVATAIVPDAVAIDRQTGAGINADNLLKQAGFNYTYSYEFIGSSGNCGVYMSQNPPAGTRAPVGSTVVLTVGQC